MSEASDFSGSSPAQLMAAIDAYITHAEQLLEQGALGELAGLGSAVDALCSGIRQLAPEDSTAFAPELEQLRDRIGHLGTSMIAAQKDVATALTSLSSNRKAVTAYRKHRPEA